MQPVMLRVQEQENGPDSIKRIEKVQVEQYKWAYEGYNFEDHKLFTYREDAVNVHYFPGL